MRFVCDSCRAQYMISDDKVGAKGVKVRCKKCGYVILVRKTDGSDEPEESTKIAANPFANENGEPAPDTTSPGSESELSALAESTRSDGDVPSEVTNPGSPPPAGPDPNNVLGDLEDDEIGAVFDQVLKSGPHKVPDSKPNGMSLGAEDDLASTRVVSMDEIKKLAAAAEAKDDGESNGTNGHALDEPANGKSKINVPQTDWYVAVDDQQVGPLTVDQLKEKWDRGEIGPDSLCWRAGFSDWTTLSEVSQLASVFAPRPGKPVIVAPAPVSSSMGPVMNVPVESAFSAGGLTQSVRSEMPVMAMGAEPSPAESGSWKPSAASALASLAMQEVEALQKKPEPKKASSAPVLEPSSKGGLLDLPPPEQSGPNGRSGSFNALGGTGTGDTDPRIRAQQQNGFSSASAPFPQPSYSTYRPPAPPPAAPQSNKMILALAGIGGVVVLLAVVIVVMFNRQQQPVAGAPLPPAPVHVATNTLPMPPPPTGTTPIPAPATAQNPPQVAQAPASNPTPAPAATPTPTPPAQVAKNDPPALRSGLSDDEHSSRRHSRHGGRTEQASASEPAEREAPAKKSKSDEIDPFDKEFGGGSDDPDAAAKKKKGTGWIPPDPGSEAPSGPEALSQGDIMGVVVQNRSSIAACVSEQKKKDPNLGSGRMVVRWTILPSGKTSGVQVKTDEFKSTYMASCITSLVKTMTFPKHRVQGPPIDFPFTF